jgi:hypothetical protein
MKIIETLFDVVIVVLLGLMLYATGVAFTSYLLS